MMIEVTADRVGRLCLPPDVPRWVNLTDQSIEVVGDQAGLRQTFVWSSDERVLIATTLEELLTQLNAKAWGTEVSAFGISHLLNHAITPLPDTVYRDVKRIAAGDTATFSVQSGKIVMHVSSSYPWLTENSLENELPNTTTLRELIAHSTDSQLRSADGTGILMLSSGKDSVALALALADGSHTDIPCITYKASANDLEHVYAAELCERLGLDHHILTMPTDSVEIEDALRHFFTHSPLPSVDQATIPYATIMNTLGMHSGAVIDGSGNDAYMAAVPSRRHYLKSALRVRNRRISSAIKKRIRHDSPISYFTRSRVANWQTLRMFRDVETRQFYGGAIDTESYWYDVSAESGDLDPIDLRTTVLARHGEAAKTNQKVHLVARAWQLAPVLPFCDEALADYYFNLPEPSRFDRSAGTNKVLLRQLLLETVGYDPAVVGSSHFHFDGVSFLTDNADLVRDEVISCNLWLPEVESMINEWLNQVSKRPFLHHSVAALFMISGWHNHSMYLSKNSAGI